MEIFSKVDIIHVVGNYEFQILKNKFNKKIIRKIPIYIYDKLMSNIEKDFSKRKGLIFVGEFSYPSNKDDVLWFSKYLYFFFLFSFILLVLFGHKYVYPKILDRFQDMIWHIVGTNIPYEIRELESKNIKVEGSLSNKDLYSLYQKCRIAVT